MPLTRTRSAFRLIEQDRGEGARDPFIESCLAQYLVVVFYSEMEERISEIISSHLVRFTDTRIGTFLTSNMDNIIRRTSKSDIAKLVGSFDDAFQNNFNQAVTDQTISAYANIIQARHNVGHRQGSPIALSEIPSGLDAADLILDALDTCLSQG
jgi:hypothetical protein